MSTSNTVSGYVSPGGESVRILFNTPSSPATGWAPLSILTGNLSGLSVNFERDSSPISLTIPEQSPTGYSLDGNFLEIAILLPDIIASGDTNIEISGTQLTFLDPTNNITGTISSPITINNDSLVQIQSSDIFTSLLGSRTPDIRPIGSDNTVLVADSTKPYGVTWKTVDFTNIALPVEIVSLGLINSNPIVGSGINGLTFGLKYNTNSVTGVNVTAVHMSQTVYNQDFLVDITNLSDPDDFISFISVTGTVFLTGYNSLNISVTAFSPGFSDTDTTTLSPVNYIRYGTGQLNPTFNSTFIGSLPNAYTNNTIDQELSWINVPSGNYLYIANRSVFVGSSEPIFKDVSTGMYGGFSRVATNISYTNNAGYTENYNVYRSNRPWLGSVKIEIVGSGNV